MARILLTGGTGFIGSNLAKQLIQLDHELIITGVQTENPPQGYFLEPGLNGIDWSKIEDIDILFHQAANNDTTCKDRDEMWYANVKASRILFRKCFDRGCKRFIFASSTAVYGSQPAPYFENTTARQPLNYYAESKSYFEGLARDFGKDHNVNVVGLRYCNVYGPGEAHKGKRASMIYQMAKVRLEGRPVKLFKWGEQRRDFIYVDDVVAANISLLSPDPISGIYNCGSGSSATFLDMWKWVQEGLGVEYLEPEWIDNPYSDFYQNHTECDMSLIRDNVGFVPQYSIKNGIMKYMEEIRKARS